MGSGELHSPRPSANLDGGWKQRAVQRRSRLWKPSIRSVSASQRVAYGVAYLIARTGRWITGSTLVVDGGYSAQ